MADHEWPGDIIGISRAMPNPKRKSRRGERTLISIHGILSDGEWQRQYATVFDPHFHYEQFGYDEFLNIGSAFLGLALEWLVLATGCVAILWAWFHGFLSQPHYWAGSVLLLISVLLTANIFAEWRRDKVVRDFAGFVTKAVGNGLAPHIIAHSLGSFVLGRMLLRYPTETRAENIVLLGCVLSPRFEWNRTRAVLIRNEMGRRDWVSVAAGLLSPLVREMGPAGQRGFKGQDARTIAAQQASEPWQACSCGCYSPPPPPARILNIDGDLDHRDLTDVSVRAEKIWLPFLWNIPPGRFESFVDLCMRCDIHEELEQYGPLNVKTKELEASCWFWSEGPLGGFVERYLAEFTYDDREVARLKKDVLAGLFRTVALANRSSNDSERKGLFPLIALREATREARRHKTIAAP